MAMSLASGQYENLARAAQDRLHQPYRLDLIAGGGRAMEILCEAGAYCAYISGAGSTLMGIVPTADTGYLARAREMLDAQGYAGWNLLLLEPDNEGAVCTVS